MTGDLLLASLVVGLASGWLAGVVMGKGQYGSGRVIVNRPNGL